MPSALPPGFADRARRFGARAMSNHEACVDAGSLLLGDIPAGDVDREYLGHERRRHSLRPQADRILGGRRADSGGLRVGRDRCVPVQVEVLLRPLAIRSRMPICF